MEDEESRQRQVISVAQTIAMQAMELPAQERSRFIQRAVTAIRRDFDRKYGADPDTADAAQRLQQLIEELVGMIEASGGSVGRA